MNKLSAVLRTTVLQVASIILLFSLHFLLRDNMGQENEVDVLPLARQLVDPNWIQGDWYLSQPSGYRFLFNAIFGHLAASWGFLITSIAGRLICYGLVAWGLVTISKRLGLTWQWMLATIGLFLTINDKQSLVADEWFVGSLEAKSVAYGLILWAIGLLLSGRYLWMALLLGLATSFHVVVGGWTFLTVLVWLCLHWKTHFQRLYQVGLLLLVYLSASVFAIGQVLDLLGKTVSTSVFSPSFIYVFIRLPHHLNPQTWATYWWLKLIIYLLVLTFSLGLIHQKQAAKALEQHTAQIVLAELTLITLIPFLNGVVLSHFDSEGKFLQFYPFRLADVMLPLNIYLLSACALQQTLARYTKPLFLSFICLVWVAWIVSTQAVIFQKHLLALRHFPKIEPEAKAAYVWIRTHTPPEAVVVSPPAELDEFTWVAERPTIAKFKFLPQNRVAILEWCERLSDLSGSTNPWQVVMRTKDRRGRIQQLLTIGYDQMNSIQVKRLMQKYHASYFLGHAEQKLDLPQVYRNSRYILYAKQPE